MKGPLLTWKGSNQQILSIYEEQYLTHNYPSFSSNYTSMCKRVKNHVQSFVEPIFHSLGLKANLEPFQDWLEFTSF